MISDNLNQVFLQLPRSLKVNFDGFIDLTVINKLSKDRWHINILGKNIIARSKVPLTIGSRLQAKVLRSQSKLFLQIMADISEPIHDVLLRDRIPTDSFTKMIVDSLVAHNIALKTKTMMTIRRALLKLQTEKSLKNIKTSRVIRALVFIFAKKINLYSEGIGKLVSELINCSFDLYPKYKHDKIIQNQRSLLSIDNNLKYNLEVPEIFSLINENKSNSVVENKKIYSSLTILNHFKNVVGDNNRWVVLPVVLRNDTETLVQGNLRLLYDVREKICKIVVNAAIKNSVFAFVIDLQSKQPKMKAFFPKTISKNYKVKISKVLKVKMQNFGVELDDTIREESDFDGFSDVSDNELRQVINTIR